MILLITNPNDPGSAALLRAIAARGVQAAVFDYANLSAGASVTMQIGDGRPAHSVISFADGSAIDSGSVRAVWFGRPEPLVPDALHSIVEQQFVARESLEALGGLWQTLDAAWINHPVYDDIASRKPYQLEMAKSVGLKVPATLITNNPAAAQGFIERLGVGRVVHKTFVATEQFWRETRLVTEAELRVLDAVRHAPVIFQELVEADADVRAIVIGETVFAVAIRVPGGNRRIDYRVDLNACTFEPLDLPAALASTLVRFVRSMNLVYGAVDLRRTSSGDFVFLEINPCGQWLFVEERTELPITARLAAALDTATEG
jgi:glutathione synthase/RimK-type ligase-like ATP-grasp enzyme